MSEYPGPFVIVSLSHLSSLLLSPPPSLPQRLSLSIPLSLLLSLSHPPSLPQSFPQRLSLSLSPSLSLSHPPSLSIILSSTPSRSLSHPPLFLSYSLSPSPSLSSTRFLPTFSPSPIFHFSLSYCHQILPPLTFHLLHSLSHPLSLSLSLSSLSVFDLTPSSM